MRETVTASVSETLISRRHMVLLAAGLIAGVTGSAHAQDNEQRLERARRRLSKRKELKKLRKALRAGHVRPLTEFLPRFVSEVDGEVLNVSYRERGSARVYILFVLLNDGRITRYVIDGRNGDIFTFEQALKHYGITAEPAD